MNTQDNDMQSDITNIIVLGIGGQGVMTASEVLAQAALGLGLDIKKTEVAGMAQRGGVVASNVRFGTKVLSPTIKKGEADIIVAFEPAEALRWISHLRPDGVAMVNVQRQAPPVVNLGLFPYPEDPVGEMRAMGARVLDFDASAIARDLGEPRLVNTVLMGAIADHLPFAAETLKAIIVDRFRAKKPALAELNKKAFEAGQRASAAAQSNAESAA